MNQSVSALRFCECESASKQQEKHAALEPAISLSTLSIGCRPLHLPSPHLRVQYRHLKFNT
jgi:hypothetical protein